MYQILIRLFKIFLKIIQTLFKSKSNLLLENVALRQQLSTFLIKKTQSRLTDLDRSYWVALKQVWARWTDSLIIVKPETVMDWQNRRFKKQWTKLSTKNKKPGRERIKKEARDLIYRMARENLWGCSSNLLRTLDVGLYGSFRSDCFPLSAKIQNTKPRSGETAILDDFSEKSS
jgi:putative transposase